MTPNELIGHKSAPKRLEVLPVFFKAKSVKLPKPFDKMRSPRLYTSGGLSVSETHQVFLFWRDGELRTDSAFFAWLMCRFPDGQLSPLLEFHYHPSHKGAHIKTPCKTELNYTNRQLPQAPELNVKLASDIDPRADGGRSVLIARFCQACGIALGQENDLWN